MGEFVLVVDRYEPAVEEHACEPWLIDFHEVQRRGGMVEDSVDEDLEVGKAEGGRLAFVDVVCSDCDDVV